MNDHELLMAIRDSDESCYKELIERYMRYVAAIVSKVAGNRLNHFDIEEICADIFIKIWTNAERISLKGDSMKAYLAVSSRNAALNAIRDKHMELEETELDEDILFCDSAEASVMLNQSKQDMKEVISTLSETDREIIVRRYYNSEKVKDIASDIGMNEKAVSARIGRSKGKLKEFLVKRNIF